MARAPLAPRHTRALYRALALAKAVPSALSRLNFEACACVRVRVRACYPLLLALAVWP